MKTSKKSCARIALAAGIVQAVCSVAHAQLYMIEPRASMPQVTTQAISANGQVAVGYSVNGTLSAAFSWSVSSGRVDWLPGTLTSSYANGVSPDGRFDLGNARTTSNQFFGYRREIATGQVTALANPIGFTGSEGVTSSLGGSVVVGRSIRGTGVGDGSSNASIAVRWDSAGVPTPLGYVRANGIYSDAAAVTPDGTIIVGTSRSTFTEAYRWTASTGMVGLQRPSRGTFATGNAVSADGRYVAGQAEMAIPNSNGVGPVRWNEQGQWEYLGLPAGCIGGNALGINGDGRLIVGYATAPQSLPGRGGAFIWRDGEGTVLLSNYLRQAGLNIPDNLYLSSCTGVSADGRVFCGQVTDTVTRINRGFVAVIPAPSSLALLGLTGLAATRRRRVG